MKVKSPLQAQIKNKEQELRQQYDIQVNNVLNKAVDFNNL